MYLKPSQIRYSQDSINCVFNDRCKHSHQKIGHTLDALCEGRLSVDDIPTISVLYERGTWVTADNRRLWVFRHLERLGKCEKIPVNQTDYIPSYKRTSKNGGVSVMVRRNPGGRWFTRNPPRDYTIICRHQPSRYEFDPPNYNTRRCYPSFRHALNLHVDGNESDVLHSLRASRGQNIQSLKETQFKTSSANDVYASNLATIRVMLREIQPDMERLATLIERLAEEIRRVLEMLEEMYHSMCIVLEQIHRLLRHMISMTRRDVFSEIQLDMERLNESDVLYPLRASRRQNVQSFKKAQFRTSSPNEVHASILATLRVMFSESQLDVERLATMTERLADEIRDYHKSLRHGLEMLEKDVLFQVHAVLEQIHRLLIY